LGRREKKYEVTEGRPGNPAPMNSREEKKFKGETQGTSAGETNVRQKHGQEQRMQTSNKY